MRCWIPHGQPAPSLCHHAGTRHRRGRPVKVYLRDKVGKLGVAPLTSMFLFGSNQPSPTLNYRPALHDSNGLSILAGNGEWIWRPLNNPKHLAVSSYAMENPQGVRPATTRPSVLALRGSRRSL